MIGEIKIESSKKLRYNKREQKGTHRKGVQMVLVATQVKRRRGTTAENDAFTGAEGEITVDTEKHELRVHDGLTQGGHTIPTNETLDFANKALDNLSQGGEARFAEKANANMNNVTSTGKEAVVGWGIPDYSAGISLSGWGTATSNFSVPTDGVLQIIISSTSAVEEFFVDDKMACALVNVSNYTGWAVNLFPVSKGTHTWRTLSTPSRIYAVVFYPFKGVN